MTVETQTPNPAATPASVLAKLATFFQKSVSDAALKDIEQIVSVVDDHVEPSRMPTRTEVDSGPGQSMRGGQAPVQVEAHSNLLPQSGLTEMYNKFDAMMGALQKAFTDSQAKTSKDIVALRDVVKGIVDGMAAAVKAEQKEKDDLDKTREEKDSAENVAAKALAVKKAAKEAAEQVLASAFRKARIALRKAEDMDEEEEDKEEMMEKANTTLAALNAAVSKAEEDAEDDEDEKKAEKARQDLRAIKAQLKKVVTKKAAKPVVSEVKPTFSKDELSAALNEFATAKGISVSDFFSGMGIKADTTREPPTFAKAISDANILTFPILEQRIEDAVDGGLLRDAEVQKADSLKARLGAVRRGTYDAEALAREISLAPPAVQSLFALPQAA